MQTTSAGGTDPATAAWSTLGRGAKAFRVAHAAAAVVNLTSLGYLWLSAATRRRDRWLLLSTGLLLTEGGALVIGHGDCPLGPFQRTLGDPIPLFELVLPPRAAKAAIPVLAVGTFAGFAAVIARPPRGPGVKDGTESRRAMPIT